MSICCFRPYGIRFLLCAALIAFAASAGAQSDSTATAPEAPSAAPPSEQPDSTAAAAPAPPPAAPTPTPAQPAAADSVAPDPDGGWPRSLVTPSGATLIMFQPQILSWDGQTQLIAMAALSYAAPGAAKAELGTITVASATSVSMEERLVNLQQIQVTEIKFSSLAREKSQEVLAEIKNSLPDGPVVIALDRVLARLDKSAIRADGIQVKTDPPPIFHSTKPAILVQFDGDPIWSPIEGTALKYVINTNWDVFQDTGKNKYYLRHDSLWLETEDLAKKWKPTDKLPDGFKKLPKDGNWNEVEANLPWNAKERTDKVDVFVSMKPAELILTDGDAEYERIAETDLAWINNSESDLFRIWKKDFYYLVSGRWFRAPELKGPWTFATADLPPDFQKIPPDHDRARVRSSVPGTDEAAEAVLLAQVPQTARVNAKEIKAPDVSYQGEPQFAAIEGSPVTYAANASHDVLRLNNTYYLCHAGVWFTSTSPNGPWVVTTSVPDAIYAIPASSAVHHVTYVVVVDDDPDYPTYAYTSGYVGMSIAFGCAMWGTGYYYPPYYHYPPYGPPIYYPRPVTYGCGAAYNPYTGGYGYYQHAYGPYGGVARGASYNPTTGTYKRGAVAYGPTGAQGYAQAYNPRTGTYAATRQGSNVYGSWGSSHVQRGDDWVNTQRVTDSNGNTRWAAQGSGGGEAKGWRGPGDTGGFVGQSGSGDVYAGRNGEVYRKTDDGWQSWDSGGWNDVGSERPSQLPAGAGERPSTQPGQQPSTRPSTQPGQPSTRPSTQPAQPSAQPSQRPSAGTSAAPMDQLDRDQQARKQGTQRTREYSSYRQGGSGRATASSSGARRGGGGGGRRR